MNKGWLIEKEFHFSASHQLRLLPDDHQCARLHGHNYILKVGLGGVELNDVGFILDYGEMSFVKDFVDKLDHRHLNDIFNFNPTSELICQHVLEDIVAVELLLRASARNVREIHVSLSETPKTWASYSRRIP